VLPVTTFHVRNSAILFYFILCVYVVRIALLCSSHELHLGTQYVYWAPLKYTVTVQFVSLNTNANPTPSPNTNHNPNPNPIPDTNPNPNSK